MNILYITHTSLDGGATKALINIVEGLVNKGHRAYVLTDYLNGPLVNAVERVGGVVFNAPISLTTYVKRRNFIRSMYHTIKNFIGWQFTKVVISNIIRKYQIEIVHTNVGPLNLALRPCIKHSIPHVWHHREFFDKFSDSQFFPSNRNFYKLINSKGNYNICITKQVFDYCKLSENNSLVIYDGVFYERDSNIPKVSHKDKYFLFVGRVERNKGLDVLLRSFTELHRIYPEYELKIAGYFSKADSYYQECRKIITEGELLSSVSFLGLRDDVFALMEHATALVVPSHYEGFGFITAEAMLNQTLVIGNNTTGTKEQFDIGLEQTGQEIGLRYSTQDELVGSLFRAVEDNHIDMILRAKEVVSKLYTVERSVSEIEDYYRKCILDNNSI